MEKNDELEAIRVANRATNIAYIFAGLLQLACEDMDEYLYAIKSCLRQDNKKHIGKILKLSRDLQKLIDDLERISILKCSEEKLYSHDTSLHQYYAHILNIIQIVGIDDQADLRSLTIYNLIKNFKPNITFPKMEVRELQAFLGTKTKLANGTWEKEVIRKCIEIKPKENESTDETNKGKD